MGKQDPISGEPLEPGKRRDREELAENVNARRLDADDEDDGIIDKIGDKASEWAKKLGFGKDDVAGQTTSDAAKKVDNALPHVGGGGGAKLPAAGMAGAAGAAGALGKDGLGKATDAVKGGVGKIGAGANDAIRGGMDRASGAVGGAKSSMGGPGPDGIKGRLDKAGDAIRGGADQAGDAIRAGADKAGDAIRGGAERAGDVFKGGAEKAADVVKGGADTLKGAVAGTGAVGAAGILGAKDSIKSAADKVDDAWDKTRDSIKGGTDSAKDTALKNRDDLKAGLTGKVAETPRREPLTSVRRDEAQPPRIRDVERPDEPNRRNWLIPALAALLGLALIGGIAALVNRNRDDNTNNQPQAVTPSVAVSPLAPAPQPVLPSANVPGPASTGITVVPAGIMVRDGDVEFQVTGTECVGPRIGTDAAGLNSTNGRFCTVSMRVRNAGTTPWTYTDVPQKGYGDNKQWYSADTAASAFANPGVNLTSPVAAGGEVDIVTAYDVPATIQNIDIAEMHASVGSAGVFSNTH